MEYNDINMKPMKIWIAHNKSGTLETHKNKPTLSKLTNEPIWIYDNFIGYIFQDLFPDVTFENSSRLVEINYVMN